MGLPCPTLGVARALFEFLAFPAGADVRGASTVARGFRRKSRRLIGAGSAMQLQMWFPLSLLA
jgi:hypothetical protein